MALINNHEITVVNKDGQPERRRVGCTAANRLHNCVHLDSSQIEGKDELAYRVMSCADAEDQRQQLLRETDGLGEQLAAATKKGEDLEAEVANYKRLIAGAMKIVFGLGPALQQRLAETLSDPELTDDQTAVKLEGMLFIVLIDPFGERITVRDVSGNVPERSFPVSNGRVDEDNQTLLLGHVERIRRAAHDDGIDPISGTLDLLRNTGTPATA